MAVHPIVLLMLRVDCTDRTFKYSGSLKRKSAPLLDDDST